MITMSETQGLLRPTERLQPLPPIGGHASICKDAPHDIPAEKNLPVELAVKWFIETLRHFMKQYPAQLLQPQYPPSLKRRLVVWRR